MNVTQAPMETESIAVVRFQDCDPYQHLNNARHIDYMLNAWEDQLQNFYDFSLFQHIKLNEAGWVVTKTQIAYLYPAALSEEVVLQTRLLQMRESGLVVESIMLDKQQKRPKSIAWIEFVYVSLVTKRPVNHTADLFELFQPVREKDLYTLGFDERVESVKRHYRQLAEASAAAR